MVLKITLLKYFKRAEPKKNEKIDAILPKVDGPLAKVMPMSSNTAVRTKLLETLYVTESDVAAGNDRDTCTSKRHGKYQFFTPKEKAEYRKRAATYGIMSTIRYFAKVDKQAIFTWKEGYLKELAMRKHDEVPEVEVLPPKKRGCPLLIGVQLDDRVKLYVKEMRHN